MVIVVIAFVSILVSLILYTTLINYQIKAADLRNKRSFYTAEHALEEIKAGLEQDVSWALGGAYLSVMEDYAQYTDEQRSEEFQSMYVESLRSRLKGDTDKVYNLAYLTAFLQDTAWIDGEEEDAGTGAKLTAKGTDGHYHEDTGLLLAYEDAVVLKDLMVTYLDEKGNVSRIRTDIRLQVPNMTFNESFKLPDILSYCVIANRKLDATASTDSTLSGSVYGGSEGMVFSGKTTLNNADLIVTDGEVLVEGTGTVQFASDTKLWAQGIDMQGKTLNLLGNSYIQDDLTINNSHTQVTIAGDYYGYGYGEAQTPKNNSAILINGTNTSLNMSDVSHLFLAGHAYIGTNLVADGTIPEGEYGWDNTPIQMGESLAAKSDQLAYLVPIECLWVNKEDGKSLAHSNPIPEADINGFTSQGATEFDASKVPAKYAEAMNYVDGFKTVYRNDSGIKMIYYYFTFSTEQKANRFFSAYYAADKEQMDQYLKIYLSDYQSPNRALEVNIAGNMFTMVNGQYVLKEGENDADDVTERKIESDTYAETYTQLCTTLSRTEPTDAEKNIKADSGLFYNIIDKNELEKLIDPTKGANYGSGPYLFLDEEGKTRVVVVNNVSSTYVIDSLTAHDINWEDVRILLATGDVKLSGSLTYKGIVIAGKEVALEGGIGLESDSKGVSEAMQAYIQPAGETEESSKIMAVNLFVDGSYTFADTEDIGITGEVRTDELVVFENWNKE